MSWTRRQILAGGAALMAAGRARAFGAPTHVDIAELNLGPGTVSRPHAWRRLLYDVVQYTSVECESRSVLVTPEDPLLFEHPFCVLMGNGPFADPTEQAVKQIEQYVLYGGFLFIDDTTGSDESGFDASVRRLLERVFPTRPLAPLPADHSVNRAFFLLKGCAGRIDQHKTLEAVTVASLAPVVYCRNDISGALDRTESGSPVNACIPGGEIQRGEAMKLGVNLLMYSLTADYKSDQAHIRQLMLEHRIK